jgi:hypothetical protein
LELVSAEAETAGLEEAAENLRKGRDQESPEAGNQVLVGTSLVEEEHHKVAYPGIQGQASVQHVPNVVVEGKEHRKVGILGTVEVSEVAVPAPAIAEWYEPVLQVHVAERAQELDSAEALGALVVLQLELGLEKSHDRDEHQPE